MHAAQCIPDIPRATQHVQPLQAINVVGRSIVEHLAQRCGEILRIRGGAGTLVTAIELLSPANKRPGVNGADAYEQKRQEIFDSTVNLLEIDLLRNGRRPQVARPLPDAPYFVFLSRVQRRPYSEIWSLSLREPIKLLPVPLLYPAPPRLSSVDFFAGSHWNAVSGTGSGCRSSAVFSALGRAVDAQKRVPTIKSLHLRAPPRPA